MALTVTINNTQRVGRQYQRSGTLAFDSSYPTGGEALTAAQLGFTDIERIHVGPHEGYVFEWDEANEKVLAYWADNDAGADSALVQVANGTNLSTQAAVPFSAYGI